MRPLSVIVTASLLAAALAGPASATSHGSRTAATYVADCRSADEEREEQCLATFVSAIVENRSGPGSLCNPDVDEDKVYAQALKAADWLWRHPENLRLEESAGVRFAQWKLWACKRAAEASV